MIGLSRGGALVETALSLGLVLLILLGTLQFGVIGFRQIAQDGAAFVAAHTYAQSPTSGTARATTAASSAFDAITGSAIAVTPSSGAVTATIASTMTAPSIPGSPAAISVRSGATERISAPAVSAGAFSATNVLSNFRDASGVPAPTHSVVVAQPGLPAGGCDQTGGNAGCDGNHQHVDYPGTYGEWSCRLAAYSGVTFPSQRPKGSGTGPGSVWDPASSSSPLYSIYQFDTGKGC
ncbi:MAG: hypothetical protein JWO66_21 [Candidatus Eremiobacteraeota bacterium]|nr:hypothetical protein [Candidatus Eremiobacteraeota bacterium]